MKTNVKAISAVAFFLLLLVLPAKNNAGNNIPTPSFTVIANSSSSQMLATRTVLLYDALKLKSLGLTKAAFDYAYKGYSYLQKKGMLARASVLTICDFSQSSRRKRLFVIDVNLQKVLINTYVAHGRRSGSEYARSFSNNPDSHMSSLGFYKTETTYYGGHGLSLKIEGLESGFNDKAEARNIAAKRRGAGGSHEQAKSAGEREQQQHQDDGPVPPPVGSGDEEWKQQIGRKFAADRPCRIVPGEAVAEAPILNEQQVEWKVTPRIMTRVAMPA